MSNARAQKSLASKFFVLTTALVLWVAAVLVTYDVAQATFQAGKGLLLIAVVITVVAVISSMTTRLLTRPLHLLQEGIHAVEEGRLEPVVVSRTGDEIEVLGESFNRMVEALAASRTEVRDHQQMLEHNIRERTAELEAAMREALAANEAKSDFLANMSHELRTPMNGLLGMLDMVLATPLSAEQRDQLETSHSCAYSLLAILNDVLDLSKIQSGHMALERIAFDPRAVIRDAVRSYAAVAERKGVAFRLELGSSLPGYVEADPLRIRQILTNLVSNAVKFTEHGFIEVAVSAARSQASGFDLMIIIRDSGMGIAADKLDAVFEKFTQADGSITRRFGGTGLGLTITKHLVEIHGGTISVESAEACGSTFSVTLPCSAADVKSARGDPEQSGSRILVVDDNAVNRKMVSAILERHGYVTAVARDGSEALEVLAREGADLVLMDLQMPRLDGYATTRCMRGDERWSGLPIIAMTAHAMPGDEDSCLEAGMTGYLSKPVHATHLLHTVERLLTHSRSLQASA